MSCFSKKGYFESVHQQHKTWKKENCFSAFPKLTVMKLTEQSIISALNVLN